MNKQLLESIENFNLYINRIKCIETANEIAIGNTPIDQPKNYPAILVWSLGHDQKCGLFISYTYVYPIDFVDLD